jgi:excisionase family DNA binding protein
MANEQEVAATLTSSDVMKRLNISRRTLERYIADEKIPVRRLPSGHRRFLAADVEALLGERVA